MKEEKEIRFIAQRYRKGLFDADTALHRIMPARRRLWTPVRIAAAVAGMAVIGATAGLIIHNTRSTGGLPEEVSAQQPASTAVNAERVMDFEEARLPEVVAHISETYGVTVGNLPENAEEYVLSLHYEGTAEDLVETINDILGTEMTVE